MNILIGVVTQEYTDIPFVGKVSIIDLFLGKFTKYADRMIRLKPIWKIKGLKYQPFFYKDFKFIDEPLENIKFYYIRKDQLDKFFFELTKAKRGSDLND